MRRISAPHPRAPMFRSCQIVGFTTTGASGTWVDTIGRPHWGHAGAASETSRPQSGQGTRAIPGGYHYGTISMCQATFP